MERSPFPYQGPLEPEQVTGREELRRDLAQRITDRRLTALIGPRRFGKTSLLKRVAADLEAVGPQPVWIDLYELTSMSDLAARVDKGLSAAVGPMSKLLGSIASSMSLNLGVVRTELSGRPSERPDPVLTLQRLLETLAKAAERHDTFVVFDEFSGVDKVEGAAGALRTALQHSYQKLGIVFAGSEPSTMRALFEDRNQPFFSQADLIDIGPLETGDAHRIIEEGFETTGRAAGASTSQIVAFSQGHPQRAMQLADAVWRLVAPGETADEFTWAQALSDVREQVSAGIEHVYSLLPAGHQQTLRAAAAGSIYGAAADFVDLNPGTAKGAAEALTGNGILRRTGNRYEVIDPLMSDWLRLRFV